MPWRERAKRQTAETAAELNLPLPTVPQISADSTPEELAQAATALNVVLLSIDHRLKDIPKTYITKGEATRRRRTFFATVVTSVLVAVAVVVGINNYAITRCFLTTSPSQSAACNRFFPGYNRVEKKAATQQAQFKSVLDQIPVNQATIVTLQQQVIRQQRQIDEQAREIARLQRGH
jgi:hypothetical protein